MPSHYMECRVLSRDNRGVYVEWHDGSRERLSYSIAGGLALVKAYSLVGVRATLTADPLTDKLRVSSIESWSLIPQDSIPS